MVVNEFEFYANNDLSSGFLSKTIESARRMDMSSLNSCRTLSVCIKKSQLLDEMLIVHKLNQTFAISIKKKLYS